MLKKIIIPIVVFGAVYAFQKHDVDLANPAVITKPVYAETRVSMESPQGSLEMLVLTQAVDQLDCEAQTAKLEKDMKSGEYAVCDTCTAPQSKCLAELPPRFASMFDNKPGNITYLSLLRGEPTEREHRVIYWGITVAQSDTLCSVVPEFQKIRKGEVACVRARRG